VISRSAWRAVLSKAVKMEVITKVFRLPARGSFTPQSFRGCNPPRPDGDTETSPHPKAIAQNNCNCRGVSNHGQTVLFLRRSRYNGGACVSVERNEHLLRPAQCPLRCYAWVM